MAGQITLDTRYYPSDFNYESVVVSGSSTGTYDLLYADRPMVIDSIMMTVPNLPTNNPADDFNVKFRKFNPVKGISPPSFATVSSGGMVIEDVTETRVIKIASNGGGGSGTAADYPEVFNFPILTTSNVLQTGEILRYTGVALTSVIQVTFQIRWRSLL